MKYGITIAMVSPISIIELILKVSAREVGAERTALSSRRSLIGKEFGSAVEELMAVAAMSVALANVAATVRVARSAACQTQLVITPVEMLTLHSLSASTS